MLGTWKGQVSGEDGSCRRTICWKNYGQPWSKRHGRFVFVLRRLRRVLVAAVPPVLSPAAPLIAPRYGLAFHLRLPCP